MSFPNSKYPKMLKKFCLIEPVNDQCFPPYRNQSIDLQCKSIDWFLYDGEHWSLMGEIHTRLQTRKISKGSCKYVNNLSVKIYVCQEECKTARLKPLFKKGPKIDPTN